MGAKRLLLLGLLLLFLSKQGWAAFDYGQALSKSILYFEAQRSGKLPPTQRVLWRGDSALKDGSDAGVDLTGGYYDSGDNVKFGFPLAFTVTLLAWSAADFDAPLRAKNELGNALRALQWGTDYLIKAHTAPDVLYVQVGDGQSDHDCWQRPEEMTTPRPSYKLDPSKPGADAAGETAAALAAASIAFRGTNPAYSNELVSHARQLFDFARNHLGVYQNSVPGVGAFYSSSGYEDELLWAAAWLYRATGQPAYLNFLASGNTGGTRTTFSWDDKYTGAQALVSKLILEGKVSNNGRWAEYQTGLIQFICNAIQKGSSNVKKTPGGGLWWLPFDNLQYTTSALLVILSHADALSTAKASLQCSGGATVTPNDLVNFARSQVDYILGANPNKMSYMVGFGSSYPVQVHHRGASIVSIKKDPTPVSCKGGFDAWFNKNAPNPNVIEGAVVGGPDDNDHFSDSRSNYQQAEAATVTTAPLVGVLARLA